jgi:hypothetical protein
MPYWGGDTPDWTNAWAARVDNKITAIDRTKAATQIQDIMERMFID